MLALDDRAGDAAQNRAGDGAFHRADARNDRASGRAQFYPRPQSLYGEAGVEWREASGRGTIFALTLSRVGPPQLAGAVPYPMALVQLAEGPRVLARVNAPYEQLAAGQAVEVDWNHPDSRRAFPVFRPAA